MAEDYNTSMLDLNLQLGLGSYVQNKVNKPLVNSKEELAFDLNQDDKANELSLKRVHEEHPNDSNEEITISTNDKNGGAKKLRLTKEQSDMLEDAFKLHNTINTVSKYCSLNFISFLFLQ